MLPTLYVIKSTLDTEVVYKIGFTKRCVEKRLKEFETGNSQTLSIHFTFESEYATKIESSLHKFYSSKRIKGEWFYLDDSDLENVKQLCQVMHDNFTFLKKNKNPFIK